MRLRELRQEEGLTTYQMAERLEINWDWFDRIRPKE